MKKNTMAIAIDGPAAAGKSTVAKEVAHQLSCIYVDTGAMYRALTWKAIQEGVPLDNEDLLWKLLNNTEIKLAQTKQGQRVLLNGKDVSDEIRTERVTNSVSFVAEHNSVRKEMVNRQQQLIKEQGVVMDGRDIGTHVIPNAEVKIFMIASVQERAERRHKENLAKGYESNLEQLKQDIRKRDQIDSARASAPLVKAEDAIELDTTSLSIEEVVDQIIEIVKTKQLKEG